MKKYSIGSIFEDMTTKKATKPAPKRETNKKSNLKNIGKPLKYKLPNRIQQYIQGISDGKSKKRAALDAGYSKSVAENTKNVIENTKFYQSEIERLKGYLGGEAHYLDLISKRLWEILMKNESTFHRNENGEMQEFIGSQPDNAVIKAIDVIAKLTGLYTSDQIPSIEDEDDLTNLSTAELRRLIAENDKKLAALKKREKKKKFAY